MNKSPSVRIPKGTGADDVYVGLARHVTPGAPRAHSVHYAIIAGRGDALDKYPSLIAIRRVPRAWEDDIRTHLMGGQDARLRSVGIIDYHIKGETAVSYNYSPKRDLAPDSAKGFPYFVEAMAVHDLQKRGIGLVSTSDFFTEERFRLRQLARVQLPVNMGYDAQRWKAGLGRGIRSVINAWESGLRERLRETERP